MNADKMPIVNKDYYDVYEYDSNEVNKEQAIKDLKKALKNKDIELIGYCEKCKGNGDLIIDYHGVGCKMEADQVSPLIEPETGKTHKGLNESKVGTNIKFKVIDYKDNCFLLSRKIIIEAQREKINKELKIGDKVEGKVTAINENLGCFVNIGADFSVLMSKKFLEYIFVERITDHINLGDTISGCIINIERNDKGEITGLLASRVATLPSYGDLVSEFSEGDVILADVTGISNKGIYVKLNKHIAASCRFKPNIYVQPGDRVRVKLKKITMTGINKINADIISKVV